MTKITNLRNVKIDLRDPVTGEVDKEKSAAFQEAVFESGGKWLTGSVKVDLSNPLYVDSHGNITWGGNKKFFDNHKYQEINFTYKRKLEWEATAVEKQPERKIVNICGVDYYEDKLDEILKFFEAARVSNVDVGITPKVGTGTPPDRPVKEGSK